MLNNKFQNAAFVWLKFKPEILMTIEAVVWRAVVLKKFAIFIEKHPRRTQGFSCEL